MPDPGYRRGGGITTTGTGRVAVVPDLAVLRLAAQATDASSATAHQRAGEAVTALVAALRAAGVADRDLRTAATHAWTDPGTTVSDGDRAVTRRPSTTVTLTLEARVEVARAGELIGVALDAAGEAARLEQTVLRVSDPTSARARARELAFAEARAAAVQLAELAGRGLGRVLDVREVPPGGAGPVPERMMARAAAAVPVEAGEQEVVVELVVRHGWAEPSGGDRAEASAGGPAGVDDTLATSG